MSNAVLLQIVPYRTSAPDGIGDYAVHLAKVLKDNHDLDSVFIAGSPAAAIDKSDDGWPTFWPAARTSKAFTPQMQLAQKRWQPTAVIVHVAGYGYQKRGAPFWLLHALKAWRNRNLNVRLIGIFHELYATGKIWNSSFWLRGAQKHVARELWKLCDSGLTTNSVYAAELLSWRRDGNASLAMMPVVSNVGEPEQVPTFSARQPRAMIFGRAGVETELYGTYGSKVADFARALGIKEIIDIGSRPNPTPADLDGIAIRSLGQLSAQDVSHEAQTCQFGFLTYDAARLGKSGIFAAYAANGVIPICVGSRTRPGDGLIAGQHLFSKLSALPPPSKQTLKEMQSMQDNLLSWYKGHKSAQLGACVARLCNP